MAPSRCRQSGGDVSPPLSGELGRSGAETETRVSAGRPASVSPHVDAGRVRASCSCCLVFSFRPTVVGNV